LQRWWHSSSMQVAPKEQVHCIQTYLQCRKSSYWAIFIEWDVFLCRCRKQEYKTFRYPSISHWFWFPSNFWRFSVKRKINLHVWLIERWSARPEYQANLNYRRKLWQFPPWSVPVHLNFLFLLLFVLDNQNFALSPRLSKEQRQRERTNLGGKGLKFKILEQILSEFLVDIFHFLGKRCHPPLV